MLPLDLREDCPRGRDQACLAIRWLASELDAAGLLMPSFGGFSQVCRPFCFQPESHGASTALLSKMLHELYVGEACAHSYPAFLCGVKACVCGMALSWGVGDGAAATGSTPSPWRHMSLCLGIPLAPWSNMTGFCPGPAGVGWRIIGCAFGVGLARTSFLDPAAPTTTAVKSPEPHDHERLARHPPAIIRAVLIAALSLLL